MRGDRGQEVLGKETNGKEQGGGRQESESFLQPDSGHIIKILDGDR